MPRTCLLPLPALGSCVLALALLGGARATAQCTSQWLPGSGAPGVDNIVDAFTTWDPDGAGPATPLLVVAGQFRLAGDVNASRVAVYDPQTQVWSALGSGVNGRVRALAVLPTGELIAGGDFTTAGGVGASRIARWDGATWAPLGSGIVGDAAVPSPFVAALAVLPNGDLVAGGLFTSAGGASAINLARWDGSAWSQLAGSANAVVLSLAVLPGGDLVAGGSFTSINGVGANRVARWDGAAWFPLGSGCGGLVHVLAVLPNGELVAGGNFTTAGGVAATNIARWDGSAWSGLGGGVGDSSWQAVRSLAVLPSGDLMAGGSFAGSSGVPLRYIARWDGSSWSSVGGSVDGAVHALTVLPSGELVAGGGFTNAGDMAASHVARWNGSTWAALNSGTNGVLSAFAALPSGELVAGGSFSSIGGVAAARVARWNGTSWAPLGGGANGSVYALAVLPGGDVVAGGSFTSGAAIPADSIARWDGATWTAIGDSLDGPVSALTVLANGELVAGGPFTSVSGVAASRIARWDGSTWSALGSGLDDTVNALVELPNGDLIAGGQFRFAGGVPANGLARWNGATWAPIFSAAPSASQARIYALALLPNGELVVGGDFAPNSGLPAAHIARWRWEGGAWSPVGAGVNSQVTVLMALSQGEFIAGGKFSSAGGAPANAIARWNGATWSALGSGVGNGAGLPQVAALALRPNGDLAVGGNFKDAGSLPSAYFALYGPSCVSYCSAGITTNSCAATMAGSGLASASATSGFTLSATQVEGNRLGLLFYGLSGRDALPWAPGSSSLLCVKSPTQRMPAQNSGGASGSCQGVLATDWNAFRAANSNSLGSPIAAGQQVQAQAWFRDPSAPRGTNLSNALEFTVAP